MKWQKLSGITIRLFTDNVVTMFYLNKMGGRVPHLQQVAARMLARCETRNVTLWAEYVPGVRNRIADKFSRWEWDLSDWTLNKHVFNYFGYGAHTRWISSPVETTLSSRDLQHGGPTKGQPISTVFDTYIARRTGGQTPHSL